MTFQPPFNVSYDVEADTLYLATREEPAVKGEESQGVVRRYDAQGKLLGLTILDLYDFWLPERRGELLDMIAHDFRLTSQEAEFAFQYAGKTRRGRVG